MIYDYTTIAQAIKELNKAAEPYLELVETIRAKYGLNRETLKIMVNRDNSELPELFYAVQIETLK